jgi:hypothetical protein
MRLKIGFGLELHHRPPQARQSETYFRRQSKDEKNSAQWRIHIQSHRRE